MCRTVLAVGVWILFSVAPGALAEEASPQTADALTGAWKHTAKEKVLGFEAHRLAVLQDGRLRFFRIRKDGADKFSYAADAEWIPVTWTVRDRILTTNNGEETNTYARLDAAPAELQLKPMVFGPSEPLAAERIAGIRQELSERGAKDQEVRKDPARRADMAPVDRDNTGYLKALVREIGWVDAARFGPETSNHAFLIVQHSGDLPLMVAALPAIEKDLKAGLLRDGQSFALLFDRTRLYCAEKQRYGTQVGIRDGKLYVLLIESKEKVNQFRQEVGVFPIEQYLDIFKQQSGATEVIFLED